MILCAAQSWFVNIFDDANCVDIGSRRLHSKVEGIQQPTWRLRRISNPCWGVYLLSFKYIIIVVGTVCVFCLLLLLLFLWKLILCYALRC